MRNNSEYRLGRHLDSGIDNNFPRRERIQMTSYKLTLGWEKSWAKTLAYNCVIYNI